MKSEDLKNIVKEKYGKIAEQISTEESCCCSSSCCGPQVDYAIFSENYESKDGYNSDADLNLGCGIPTDFADIKKVTMFWILGAVPGMIVLSPMLLLEKRERLLDLILLMK